jgi:hypothetical protein
VHFDFVVHFGREYFLKEAMKWGASWNSHYFGYCTCRGLAIFDPKGVNNFFHRFQKDKKS